MPTITADVTETKPMNVNGINDERINSYLAALDAAMSDPDALAGTLVAVAAKRGFVIRVGPRFITIERQTCADGSSISHSYDGREVTAEMLLDLISFFENSEEPMNIYSTDLFKYLAGDMIGQNQVTLTITAVSLEKMNSGRGGEQVKPCLHFQERDKVMVLNKTNAAAIAKELGPETDNWRGGRVTLSAPMIDAFGKQARSIRVTRVDPPDVPAKSRGNGNPTDGGGSNI